MYDYQPSVSTVGIVFQSISLACVLLALSLYPLKVLTPRLFEHRILLYMLIAALMVSIDGFILPSPLFNNQDHLPITACQVQAYLKVVSDFSEMIWTSLIVAACYVSVREGGRELIVRLEWLIIVIGYGLPFAVAIWPYAANMLGRNTYICWFSSPESQAEIAAEVVCYYAPLWASFVVNVVLVILIQRQIRIQSDGAKNAPVRVFLYPVVGISVGLFSTIHRIYYLVSGSDNYVLNLLDEAFFSMWGILVVVVYVLTPDTLKRAKLRLAKIKPGQDAQGQQVRDSRLDSDATNKPVHDQLIFQELERAD